jgi:hypothetical protein
MDNLSQKDKNKNVNYIPTNQFIKISVCKLTISQLWNFSTPVIRLRHE